MLARHGEPALSRKVKLNAAGYRDFWARYEAGGLALEQAPPEELVDFVSRADVLVSSTRQRAVESANLLAPGRDFARHESLIEAPLPPPPWPRWLWLSPKAWGFWARVHWWFLNHHEGHETRAQAEARAETAAALVASWAEDGKDVAVVAHGFFNFMIAASLRRRGWRMVARKGYRYWSTRRFVKA